MIAKIVSAILQWMAVYFLGRKSAADDAAIKSYEVRNEVDNRIAGERDARQRLRDDWSE